MKSLLMFSLMLYNLPVAYSQDNVWLGNLAYTPQFNWDHNAVWSVGDQEQISWSTNFTDYYIEIWQHDIRNTGPDNTALGKIYRSSQIDGDATGTHSFTWTVTLDLNTTPDLAVSPIFFLWCFSTDGDGTRQSPDPSFASYSFNVTQDSASETTTSATPASTSTTTSSATSQDSTSETTTSSATVASITTASSKLPVSEIETASSTTSANPSTSTTPVASSQTQSHAGTSLAFKVGLGVGLGLGVPLLLLIGGIIGWKAFARRKQKPQQLPDGPPGYRYQDSKQHNVFHDRNAFYELPETQHRRLYEMDTQRGRAELSAG